MFSRLPIARFSWRNPEIPLTPFHGFISLTMVLKRLNIEIWHFGNYYTTPCVLPICTCCIISLSSVLLSWAKDYSTKFHLSLFLDFSGRLCRTVIEWSSSVSLSLQLDHKFTHDNFSALLMAETQQLIANRRTYLFIQQIFTMWLLCFRTFLLLLNISSYIYEKSGQRILPL